MIDMVMMVHKLKWDLDFLAKILDKVDSHLGMPMISLKTFSKISGLEKTKILFSQNFLAKKEEIIKIKDHNNKDSVKIMMEDLEALEVDLEEWEEDSVTLEALVDLVTLMI